MAFVVVATWKAAPGEEERIAKIIDVLTPLARAEEKNLFFQGHVDPDDPTSFLLYEQYVDASGYEEHRDTPHFRRHVLGEAIPHLAAREVRTFHTIDA
ncbi:MAG: putative quinol monooxygenase [Pseudonocardia sp.]